MPSTLYLASQSPRRRDLLTQAGIRFQVKVPRKEELAAPKRLQKKSPAQVVRLIAEAKGRACVDELLAEGVTDALVISADTLVFQSGKILGKPQNASDATKMLRHLSGKWHSVYTGVFAFRIEGKKIKKKSLYVSTKVKFFPLSTKTIERYIQTGEPMDKAGSYGAQGRGASFIEKFSGSYTNVVGLPLGETIDLIAKLSGHSKEEWMFHDSAL